MLNENPSLNSQFCLKPYPKNSRQLSVPCAKEYISCENLNKNRIISEAFKPHHPPNYIGKNQKEEE